jgi:hypothetical protein
VRVEYVRSDARLARAADSFINKIGCDALPVEARLPAARRRARTPGRSYAATLIET